MELQNICTLENGARIISATSTLPNCSAQNILISDRRQIWMSTEGLPQVITIDLSNLRYQPHLIRAFGFDCWHDYSSNPSVIEINCSVDGENFVTWSTVYPELKQGIQLFQIDPIARRYPYFRIIIKETFGASKTYLNQVFLLEEYQTISAESVSESQPQTEHNNSQYRNEEVNHHSDLSQKRQGQDDHYQLLHQQIQSMGKEVASLKQSHQYNKQLPKQQPQPHQQAQQRAFYQKNDESPAETYQNRLTSTERMVIDIQNKNSNEISMLRREVQDWQQKCEGFEAQIQKLQKMISQILEKQNDQEDQLAKFQQSFQNQSEVSFQNNPRARAQLPQKADENVDKKIVQLTNNFQNLLQEQENRFKQQQKDLVKKFRKLLKRQKESFEKTIKLNQSSSISSAKSENQSLRSSLSNSSIIEFIRSKRPAQSKSRPTSKQRTKSLRKSNSPAEKENNRLDQNKQRKVAALVGKLKDKLQQRVLLLVNQGQIAEKLNLSQRKSRVQRSMQDLSDSSDY